jgi:hypothetical protein
MRQARHTLTVLAPLRGLHEITGAVAGWVGAQAIGGGC